MKFGTDPIFESYVNHRKQFILEESVSNFYRFNPLQQIHDLYQYDLDCIEELVTEGMLGDAFGKVKGGLEKAKSYVANKGIALFLSLVKKFATPEDLKGIEQLKDPTKLKELAAKGMQTLNAGSGEEQPVTNNEGVYLNKRFFASSILTESNIEVMLERYSFVNEQILSEAAKSPKAADESLFSKDRQLKAAATKAKRSEAGKKGQAKAPYGGKAPKAKKTTEAEKPMQLSKYVKQVADELKKKYSPKQVSKFQGMLSKKLGTGAEQTSQRAPITGLRQRPTDVSRGTEASLVPSRGGAQAGTQKQLGGGSSEGRIGQRIPTVNVPSVTDDAEAALELPYTDVEAPATKSKEGIIRKAINWVKANPKRTAGTLLGIVAAIGIAVGGPMVLIPMLTKAGLLGTGALGTAATGAATGALAGAGIGAAKNIASQGFSNKQFSGKDLGKAALKGGATGAVGGAVAGLAKGMFDDYTSDSDATATEPVKTSDTGDTEEGGDAEYTGGTGDVSATPEDFQKYNREPMDPKSWRDKIKMTALDKLKREGGGEIDSNKYNSFVKKLVAMGKGAQGKSIESIMGESYTAQYMSLLR